MTPTFGGITYDKRLDEKRLTTALHRVFDLMKDGQWRLLAVIANDCETSEAGASARLRDLRKEQIGGKLGVKHVHRQRVTGGLWEYRVEMEAGQ